MADIQRQDADYERAMNLLRDYFEYGAHGTMCRGEGPMMKGCNCGLDELETLIDQEIQAWQEGCEHDLEETQGYHWCRRCKVSPDWDGGRTHIDGSQEGSDG